MVCCCQKTVGCNFWQPEGSDFTANSDNGTPAQTKRIIFVPPRCTRHIPNPPSHSTASEEELIIFSGFFTFGFLCRCQKTVGCNFGQPEGSHFTANSDNGTPAQTERIIFVPRRCTQHIPNPPSHSTASDEELMIFSGFFTFGCLCRFQKTFGSNFWRPEGSHFTANSDNGTHAQTTCILFVPPRCKQLSPNPPSHSTASNAELIIFSGNFTFGLVCRC